jgi:hypothetical protein
MINQSYVADTLFNDRMSLVFGQQRVAGQRRAEAIDSICELEHIAYDYVFITPPRTTKMQIAEAAMRASQRVDTPAAKKSYAHATQYLFPLYALDEGDCDYQRVLRPEMLGLTELKPRKVYNAKLHGRRWHNKPWLEVLAHLKSFMSADEWLTRHQLRALMAVNNKALSDWLKRATVEGEIERRLVYIPRGGGEQPQYRLWPQ